MVSIPFYVNFAVAGDYNMAFDECLLQEVIAERFPAAFRLYSWSAPGGITIGRNQSLDRAIDITHLDDIRVIRRITGGRAVFHDPSELTYCVVFNSTQFRELFATDSVSNSFGPIAQFLREFARRCGIRAEIVRRSNDNSGSPRHMHSAPCFESQARHELLSEGRKVVASAQYRQGVCWLQHGSIKLAGLARHPAIDGNLVRLPELDRETLTHAATHFVQAAAETLGLKIAPSEPTSELRKRICARENLISKNRLAHRQIFKQSEPPTSH